MAYTVWPQVLGWLLMRSTWLVILQGEVCRTLYQCIMFWITIPSFAIISMTLIWCDLISTSSVTLLLPRLGNSLLVLLSLGSSCWTRVTKHLSIHFKTLSEAEEALQIDYVSSGLDFGELQPSSTSQRSTALTLDNPLSPIFQFSPCKDTQPLTRSVGDLIKDFVAVADSKSFV